MIETVTMLEWDIANTIDNNNNNNSEKNSNTESNDQNIDNRETVVANTVENNNWRTTQTRRAMIKTMTMVKSL